ncbi:MAG: P22 phage major capsid protein family protein [Gammaproteobacteria bacterium]
MANTFKTTTWMAKEFLRHFENSNTFSKFVNKNYAKEYTNMTFRPGTSISIPKPARFAVTSGATASFPDITEESTSLTVAQYNASFAPTSVEMTTSVSRDQFSDRYLKPMAVALSSQIDKDGLSTVTTTVANATGTPATTPSALSTYLTAKAIALEHGMPVDDQIACIVNPAAEASIVDALKGVFHSSGEIEKQYREGKMGLAIGAKWSMDQLVASRTVGTQGGTPLVNGATQTGTSLVTDGWSNSITNVMRAGDIITLAGVYAVNPVTKQSTGRLQHFVVTAAANSDGSGNATLTISPAITTSGTTQTVSASPADNAAITVLGASAAVGVSNVLFHKDAFTLAVIPMQVYGGLDKCAVEYDPDTGISVRFTQGMDVTNDKLLVRADVLYGWAATRAEWACRIEG